MNLDYNTFVCGLSHMASALYIEILFSHIHVEFVDLYLYICYSMNIDLCNAM